MSSGKPVAGNVVRIVDPESRQALGEGQVGEVWVDGPSKGGGYWHRPEATAEFFGARIAGDEEHTYLRTGDLGFIYEGELFVCGRTKDLIIVRGVNCYPVGHRGHRGTGGSRKSATAASPPSRSSATSRKRWSWSPRCATSTRSRTPRPWPERSAGTPTSIRTPSRSLPPRSIPKTTSGKIRRRETRQLWLDGKLAPCAGDLGPTRPTKGRMPARARWNASAISSRATTSPGRRTAPSRISASTRWPGRAAHDLQALLEEHGAGELAEEVNTRLLQRLTVAEFFRLVSQFGERIRPTARRTAREALAQISAEYEAL